MRVLWAHGLEGSPNGSKPTWIADNLGWEVLCPAMSDYGWTIAEQTEVIAKNIAENEDIDVIIDFDFCANFEPTNVSPRRRVISIYKITDNFFCKAVR